MAQRRPHADEGYGHGHHRCGARQATVARQRHAESQPSHSNPRHGAQLGGERQPHKHTVELVREICEGKAHYLFSGWAEYNDVFDNTPRHRLEFCYLVDFEGDGEARAMRALFQIHGKHNRQYDASPRNPEQETTTQPQEQPISPVGRGPVDRRAADHASALPAPQPQPSQSSQS